jgi:hypothetical protein
LKTDPRSINDLSKVDEATKAFHEERAKQEAARILSQYKSSPVFAKLLSLHLAEQASKNYNKHLADLAHSIHPSHPS